MLPPGFAAPTIRNAKGTWEDKTDAELVELVIPYVLDCLKQSPPVRPTKAHFKSWHKGRTDVPADSVLCDRKPWSEWMAAVNARLLEMKKAA